MEMNLEVNMTGTMSIYRRMSAPNSVRSSIDRITLAEFGHIPVIRDTAWSVPDWHEAFIDNATVLSFVSLVERIALFDGCAVKVAGISNMITIEPLRHKGLGSLVMLESQKLIAHRIGAEFGLLLCSDDVTPFYSRLDWIPMGARLEYDQPSGKREWQKDVLIYSPDGKRPDCEVIDLNGLPW
jgi:hypothetical protein